MSNDKNPLGTLGNETVVSESPEGSVEAEYTLETPAKCPHCQATIESVHLVRILRTRVNFVSSLPRRGQLMLCSQCRSILSGSLGGLL